jgi:hypothetical protein
VDAGFREVQKKSLAFGKLSPVATKQDFFIVFATSCSGLFFTSSAPFPLPKILVTISKKVEKLQKRPSGARFITGTWNHEQNLKLIGFFDLHTLIIASTG